VSWGSATFSSGVTQKFWVGVATVPTLDLDSQCGVAPTAGIADLGRRRDETAPRLGAVARPETTLLTPNGLSKR
ncbi:hypothetical protein, partial [Saccharomonospora sp.]|uniref:hypothetical protein n=1 Tax=Saccharomonospora sp. TaxID=33913 RepID=UPI002601C01B